MVSKGNLKMALASQQGTNWKHISQKKRHKASRRRKRLREEKARNEAREDSEHRSEDDESGDQDAWDGPDTGAETEDENGGVPVADEDSVENEEFDYDALNESDSESEMEVEENVARQAESKAQSWPNGQKRENGAQKAKDEEGNEDDDENQKPIPMSDLESLPSSDREDLVPYQRLTINKTSALLASLKRIQIPTDKSASFASHMTVVVPGAPTADSIKDFNDDIQRETAFFRQAQVGAHEGRRLLRKESVPFTRPRDYFAEMVKDDGHMDKVKAQLIQEATNKKAAAEARKLRDLKKFGKQVQVAKLQDRQRQKRETLEKIKALKKKRSDSGGAGVGTIEADLFDVGIDNELSRPQKRKAGAGGSDKQLVNQKRQRKDEKYGFGGKKRNSKSGDAISSGDLSVFSGKRKTRQQRPGKERRKVLARRK